MKKKQTGKHPGRMMGLLAAALLLAACSEPETAMPAEFELTRMISDGAWDGRLVVHSYHTVSMEEPSLLVYCAVDGSTGEVTVLQHQYDMDNLGAYPYIIVASYGDSFLFSCGQEQRTLRLPSQEERGYTRYLFASASKADFWGNTQTYLPVADFAG